jgi:CRISPR-associated endonuclease/helicase Cas3
VTLPSFSEFFAAVHGFDPFPWQQRLADEVVATGWPELLDLPTGVGKTSALDVALYALAVEHARMPRRVLLVVDRRIVVDQGAEHARKILGVMRRQDAPPAARAIAENLRALWGARVDDDPFAVATLRGGMPRDNDWARRPDQPVLGVSTVDQVGSRLLFRGYGLSPSAWPIQAGLIGNDTLILLDEVHLAIPFAQTLAAIRGRFRRPVEGLPDRFAVVQMSATAGPTKPGARSFALDAKDRAHEVLAQRLRARKPARLELVKVRGDDETAKRELLAAAAVAAARGLQDAGAPVVAIVVNRIDTARMAWRILDAEHGAVTSACLVTGRMRPIDRDRMVRSQLNPSAGAGRSRADAKPMIVVATQCIEAGADLDFDGLVTECASLDALRQRFGRLDRRGERGESHAVILARSDDIAADADPVYGPALAETWRWLEATAKSDANSRPGCVDFGVSELPEAVNASGDALLEVLAPRPDAPILLPAQLDAWAQTSPAPQQSPDISLWLHGPQRTSADVQVIWRTELDEHSDLETIVAALSAVRPSALEAVTLPLYAARAWLEQRSDAAEEASIADVVSVDRPDPRPTRRASTAIEVFRWSGSESGWIASDKIRPGDTLIVGSSRGGLAAANFDPSAKDPVPDLGDLANLRGRGVASLRLNPRALAAWGIDAEAPSPPEDDESAADVRARLRGWFADQWPQSPPENFPGNPEEWNAATRALRRVQRTPVVVGDHLVVAAPVPRRELPPFELGDFVTEDDDSSFRDGEVSLRQHSVDVRDVALHFATSLGFSPTLAADIGRAAWLHDVGKADLRFQRWLRGGSEIVATDPIAKSALPAGNPRERELARERAGYPRGYRHELLSLGMIETNAAALHGVADPELVLHLVASHHGWCRPFAPATDDPEDVTTSLEHGDVSLTASTRHRRARLDSGVSDRYWSLVDRYGWWGIAWMEAVMRLADHRASEGREER